MNNNNFINKCENYIKSIILEKLIIGVEEPIFINGIGKILAKVDSGNSAYNVIHGEDFYYQGSVVVFTTYDESGRPHKLSKKVQDTITINIGAGHSEERPIILLDVKFANEEYMNVPFSVGNRAENKNKVLLGKEFLAKELDALIDVTKKRISNKGIDVEVDFKNTSKKKQLNESSDNEYENGGNSTWPVWGKKNPSGASSGLKKGWQMTKGITHGINQTFKALTSMNTNISNAIDSIKKGWSEAKEIIDNYQKSDKMLIFRALNTKFMDEGNPIIPFIQNPQVFKILDYFGTDYKGSNNNSNIKNIDNTVKIDPDKVAADRQASLNKINQEQAQGKSSANESIIEKDNILLEADNTKEWQKAVNAIRSSKRPILYLVIYNNDNVEKAKQILEEKYGSLGPDFSDLATNIKDTFDTSNMEDVIDKFKDALYKNDILYTFALCEGTGTNRQVRFLSPIIPKNDKLAFLNERPKRYENELIKDSNKRGNLKGTFYNNNTFGFNKWRDQHENDASTRGTMSEIMNNWIEDPSYTEDGYNIKSAYFTFLGNPVKDDTPSTDKTDISDDDKEGQTEETEGQTEGQTEETEDQTEETEGQTEETEGQTEETEDQTEGQTEETEGQTEGQTEETEGQTEETTNNKNEIKNTAKEIQTVAADDGFKIDEEELATYLQGAQETGLRDKDAIGMIELAVKAEELDKNNLGPKSTKVKRGLERVYKLLNREDLSKEVQRRIYNYIKSKLKPENPLNEHYKKFIIQSKSEKHPDTFFIYNFNDNRFYPYNFEKYDTGEKDKEGNPKYSVKLQKMPKHWATPIIKNKDDVLKESEFVENCLNYRRK